MKKTLTQILLVLIISFQVGCKKNTESQLYIVDSIKLGSTSKDFEKQMAKKINFSKKPGRSLNRLFFVTEQILNQNEVSNYMTGSYYTLTFNNNDTFDLTDYALIIPTNSSTKDNLIGLTVIFGRTANSIELPSMKSITNSIGEPVPYFVQANVPSYIENIKNLLIKKYGEPTKVISRKAVPFYAFKGTNLSSYITNINNTGNILEWDNDVVKITFFEGIDNYNYTYNPSNDNYFSAIDEDRNLSKKLEDGNEITKGFSYLKYELKEDYIKQKKLDEPNL